MAANLAASFASALPFSMSQAGFVAVVGLPNAGKSTLLNLLIGQKLAITSPKPQSTRNRVVGILTEENAQIVFVDTPGLVEPRYTLHRAMRGTTMHALIDADVVLYVCDATAGDPPPLASLTDVDLRGPVLTALNKVDRLRPEAVDALRRRLPDSVLISATRGDGIEDLKAVLRRAVPEGPFFYSEDDASTQSVRFFVSEIVREVVFEQFEDELPYALACEIEEFREDARPVYIRASIFVERESQRRILIGSGGVKIRDLGREARRRIEELVQQPVYLDLWAKVLHNWRRNPSSLKRLGYSVPDEQST